MQNPLEDQYPRPKSISPGLWAEAIRIYFSSPENKGKPMPMVLQDEEYNEVVNIANSFFTDITGGFTLEETFGNAAAGQIACKKKVLVTGATSGLGMHIANGLRSNGGFDVFGVGKEAFDVSTEEGCRGVVGGALEYFEEQKIDILINSAGINYIDWHEDIPIEKWDELMGVNAKSMWLLTKLLLQEGAIGGEKSLKEPAGTIVNIVSNASHVPMTNSAAYNASKGAAAILTRQMARELRKTKSITVFGVSPNKMHSTQMSDYIEGRVCELRGWTPQEAREYQAAALPALKETDPKVCAEFITYLLSTTERHQYLNGCIMEYGI